MVKQKDKSEYPEIRRLTRADRKTLSELIQAFVNRSGNSKLTEMIPAQKPETSESGGEAQEEKTYEMIKAVLTGVMDWAEDELAAWFMDLIGCTSRDEYDDLPFDIEVHIIDELIKQKGFSNFFLRASELYKKIRG